MFNAENTCYTFRKELTMAGKSLNKKFYPPKEIFDSFTIREQDQLSLLIGSNIVFMLLFTLFGIALFLFDYPVIGGGSVFLLAFFATSLVFIKKGYIHRGAWTTTIAIVLLTAVVCFGSPYKDSNFLPYRECYFITVMTICNFLISLRRKQLYGYFAMSGILWILTNVFIYKPRYIADPKAFILNVVICTLGVITANICILLYDQFTRNVVVRAAENEKKSAESLQKISNLISETKEGLNIGKQLSASTGKATENIEEIRHLYEYINKESISLSQEAGTVRDSSLEINDKAEQMRLSVQDQSKAITQTSAALTEMSANIANISGIASQQRSGMNSIVHDLDSQMALMRKLVDDVQQVKESSDKVSNFVQAVNNIAAQTGLLAMNASIEAAHAGSLGKGFSVIAQEIRKLSEETTKNAQNITDTLKENEEIVNTTTASVATFSEHTKATTNELRNTIGVIEEILSGIAEIDAGTRDVMNSITHVVDDSHKNTELAEGVAEEILLQNASLHNISWGTDELRNKVSTLEGLLHNIRGAIDEIDKHASENEAVAEKINTALN